METIMITDENLHIATGHSSKGNQWKWKIGEWWYKADRMGYEGMSETVVSHLLPGSFRSKHVLYEPVKIRYHGRELSGCRSKNFLGEREELITVEKLFRQYTGMSLAKELSYMTEIKRRIAYTVDHVVNYTGLADFGGYLTGMLEMDAFFLNEDRHTNNIAVIYDLDEKSYRLCPYFDMGLSLFSDIKGDFPLQKSREDCRKAIIAKPFSRDFDEQMDAANELYGNYLHFSVTKNDMIKEVDRWQFPYENAAADRVKDVLRYQADKYRYMMTKEELQ